MVAKPTFVFKKFPTGALTEPNAVIEPMMLIQPGVATGVNGVGIPKLKPPSDDVNPKGPAYTPIPALTRESALSVSQATEPCTNTSEPKFILSDAVKFN